MVVEDSIARRVRREADDDLFVEACDPLAVTAHICQGILAGDVNSVRAKLLWWSEIRVTEDMHHTVEHSVDRLAEQAQQRLAEQAAEKAKFPRHHAERKKWED